MEEGHGGTSASLQTVSHSCRNANTDYTPRHRQTLCTRHTRVAKRCKAQGDSIPSYAHTHATVTARRRCIDSTRSSNDVTVARSSSVHEPTPVHMMTGVGQRGGQCATQPRGCDTHTRSDGDDTAGQRHRRDIDTQHTPAQIERRMKNVRMA